MQLQHHTAAAAEEADTVVDWTAALQPIQGQSAHGNHLVFPIMLHWFICQGQQQCFGCWVEVWVPAFLVIIHLHHLPAL